MTTGSVGAKAEKQAETWLSRQGLKLKAKNYRGRGGEIDLIMQDGSTLVFIEVRFRSNSDRFGGALASIDQRKIQRIVKTSLGYLQQFKLDMPCRFDVVTVDAGNQIEWIKNAFEGAY